MSESKKKATLDGETEMHWISACVRFVFLPDIMWTERHYVDPQGPTFIGHLDGLEHASAGWWWMKPERRGEGSRREVYE